MPWYLRGIAIILEFDRNSEGWINLSFGVCRSGEGSRVESKDGIGLDSTGEDSLTLDITFAMRDLVLMTEEECVYEMLKEFYLLHHSLVCKTTSSSHV
jgi:hypothetical protein